MPVDAAFGQAIDAPHGLLPGIDTIDGDLLPPHAQALALAGMAPQGGLIGDLLRRNGLDRRAARVPLDQEVQLAPKGFALLGDGMHQGLRTIAGVRAHQNRAGHQPCGHGQHPLQVIFALPGRMLHARSQGQLQPKACRTQTGGNREVAIDSGVGAAHQLLLGITVVHRERIDVQRRVAAREGAKVNGSPARQCGWLAAPR